MSKRAEQFARKLYTPWSEDGMSRKDNTEVIEACIKGYEQAEKDLALTWEDVKNLDYLMNDVESENKRADTSGKDIPFNSDESFYGEILIRFNEKQK